MDGVATAARWDFLSLPNHDGDTTSLNSTNIGLFRYESILKDNTSTCVLYSRLFVGRDYPWLQTAQLCCIFGPLLGLFAMLTTWFLNKHPARSFVSGSLLLLAAGVQSASVVASTSYCQASSGGFWDCPWLMGAHANILAAVLFFLGWLVAIGGICKKKKKKRTNTCFTTSTRLFTDNKSTTDTQSRNSSEAGSLRGLDVVVEEPQPQELPHGLPQGDDDDLQDVELDASNNNNVKEEQKTEEPKKITAEELLGTNDAIVFRAVSQGAQVIRNMKQMIARKQQPQHDPLENYSGDQEDNFVV